MLPSFSGRRIRNRSLNWRVRVRHALPIKRVIALLASIACIAASTYALALVAGKSDSGEGYLVLTHDRIEASSTQYSRNFRDLAGDGHAGMLVVTEDRVELSGHISKTLCSGLHEHDSNRDRGHSEFKPNTSYRLFVDTRPSAPPGSRKERRELARASSSQQSVDIQWIKLRALPNASIHIENMEAVTKWIDGQLDERRGVVVCCAAGADQCNAMAALHLMYSKCWRLRNVEDFLSSAVYSRHLSRRYVPALTAYEAHLRDTKC